LGAVSAEPSLTSGLKSIFEGCERRIPDIVEGVLKDAVRKKDVHFGVMISSSCRSKFGNVLYLQGLTGSIPVRVLSNRHEPLLLCLVLSFLQLRLVSSFVPPVETREY
jgi:hypothetical protein